MGLRSSEGCFLSTLFTWGGCEGQPLRRKSSPFCFVKVSFSAKNTARVKLQKLKVTGKR